MTYDLGAAVPLGQQESIQPGIGQYRFYAELTQSLGIGLGV
jgi:hypothetical protein